jgi:hypothetical protein
MWRLCTSIKVEILFHFLKNIIQWTGNTRATQSVPTMTRVQTWCQPQQRSLLYPPKCQRAGWTLFIVTWQRHDWLVTPRASPCHLAACHTIRDAGTPGPTRRWSQVAMATLCWASSLRQGQQHLRRCLVQQGLGSHCHLGAQPWGPDCGLHRGKPRRHALYVSQQHVRHCGEGGNSIVVWSIFVSAARLASTRCMILKLYIYYIYIEPTLNVYCSCTTLPPGWTHRVCWLSHQIGPMNETAHDPEPPDGKQSCARYVSIPDELTGADPHIWTTSM